MKPMTYEITVGIAAVILGMNAAVSAPNLTAVMLFSSDSAGNPAGDFVWDTRGLDSDFYKIWMAPGTPNGDPNGLVAPFINGPTWGTAPISLPLEQGTNRFTLFFQHNGQWPRFALSLFFNGGTLPVLSVYAPWRTNDFIPPFAANHSLRSYSLTSYPSPNAPAAGTASATISGQRVELTEFCVATTNFFVLDRVSTHAASWNGRLDYVGTFTLVVGPRRPTRPIRLDVHITEVTLCFESELNCLYQVEYRSAGTPGGWTALGAPVAGNGATKCLVDHVPLGQPQRFYRVTALE